MIRTSTALGDLTEGDKFYFSTDKAKKVYIRGKLHLTHSCNYVPSNLTSGLSTPLVAKVDRDVVKLETPAIQS